jgi:hypothetical protein
LIAQGALEHEGQATRFGVGAEAADTLQGVLDWWVVDLGHAGFLLPMFEKGHPGGERRVAGAQAVGLG